MDQGLNYPTNKCYIQERNKVFNIEESNKVACYTSSGSTFRYFKLASMIFVRVVVVRVSRVVTCGTLKCYCAFCSVSWHSGLQGLRRYVHLQVRTWHAHACFVLMCWGVDASYFSATRDDHANPNWYNSDYKFISCKWTLKSKVSVKSKGDSGFLFEQWRGWPLRGGCASDHWRMANVFEFDVSCCLDHKLRMATTVVFGFPRSQYRLPFLTTHPIGTLSGSVGVWSKVKVHLAC